MERRVRLFIGGVEVEFKTVPDILYNFQVDSVTDPQAKKIPYSKTITIPGTKQNNRIFDNFFLNDYLTGADNFDATKKTEFTIYLDSDVYETGYCRLDSVLRNKEYYEYSVSLFGGLGEFFYNLSYSDNPAGEDEKRKISDLTFFASPSSQEVLEPGFTINKETIQEAWDEMDDDASVWSVVNFASAYNGLPDDFDADKVLMNVGFRESGVTTGGTPSRPAGRTTNVVTAVTEDGKTYKTFGGYALANLSREYTAAEMREFRSYLMRPVLNCRKVIEACARPENNGGWEIVLDPSYFNSGNDYWQNMWVTLPLLSSLDYTTSEVSTSATAIIDTQYATGNTQTTDRRGTKIGDPGYFEDRLVYLSESDSGMGYDINVKLKLNVEGVQNTSLTNLVIAGYSQAGNINYASAIYVQLVAYDAFGNPVAGSDVYYMTSGYGVKRSGRGATGTMAATMLTPSDWNYTQPYGNGYVTSRGTAFVKSGGTYTWNEDISLTAQNVPGGSTLKLLVTKVYKEGGSLNSGKYLLNLSVGQTAEYTPTQFNNFSATLLSSKISFRSSSGIRTGAQFSKKQLLDTDYSPCEFLLSYAKIFGLYFLKDPVKKKISILTRKNFFRQEVVDINKYIDRTAFKVTPLVFDSKWYDWNLEADESEYGKAYENTYGKKYGAQKINTGYNFNRSTKEVLSGNIFKGAVQVLERSNAFCYVGTDKAAKPWMFPGYSYLLYNTADSTDTYEVEVPPSSTIDAFSGFTDGYLYYDLYDKVQLHTADNSASDGVNVLLLHTGSKSLSNGALSLNYYITDDNSWMNILNDSNPCWLWTNSEVDMQSNSIAIKVEEVPYFSRYRNDNGYIVRAMDFGKPDEVYIPGAYYREGSTIYEQFWKDYISDLYSKDSRVVRTKMLIRETPTIEWLRRFYYFDNVLWRMTSINDYNVGKDNLTEVEFVRVQDMDNYANGGSQGNAEIKITLSKNYIGSSGGTVEYTITIPDNGAWYIENRNSDISSISVSAGTGNYTGTWTVDENETLDPRNLTLVAYASNSSASVVLTQGVEEITLEALDGATIGADGGDLRFRVISQGLPWTASTDYTNIVDSFNPESGPATTSAGTTFVAHITRNTVRYRRQCKVTVTNSEGNSATINVLQSQATAPSTLTVRPDYKTGIPASGLTYEGIVSCSENWIAKNYYEDVIYVTPTSGTSGDTNVLFTVLPNTDEGERRSTVSFYRESTFPSDPVLAYIIQEGTVTGNTYFLFNGGVSVTISYDAYSHLISWMTDYDPPYTLRITQGGVSETYTGITDKFKEILITEPVGEPVDGKYTYTVEGIVNGVVLATREFYRFAEPQPDYHFTWLSGATTLEDALPSTTTAHTITWDSDYPDLEINVNGYVGTNMRASFSLTTGVTGQSALTLNFPAYTGTSYMRYVARYDYGVGIWGAETLTFYQSSGSTPEPPTPVEPYFNFLSGGNTSGTPLPATTTSHTVTWETNIPQVKMVVYWSSGNTPTFTKLFYSAYTTSERSLTLDIGENETFQRRNYQVNAFNTGLDDIPYVNFYQAAAAVNFVWGSSPYPTTRTPMAKSGGTVTVSWTTDEPAVTIEIHRNLYQYNVSVDDELIATEDITGGNSFTFTVPNNSTNNIRRLGAFAKIRGNYLPRMLIFYQA